MKKKIILLGLCVLLSGFVPVMAQCNQPKCYQNSIEKYQNYINKIKRERATVYNALDLTDEQIQKQEEIVKQNAPIYEEKLEQLAKENKRLYTLKKANASNNEIAAQKKVVKKIKKDVQNLVEKENKAYKKCLTREQRSKYAMLKKLEIDDYKKLEHQKDLYKSNPKMRPFGNPASAGFDCSCDK